MIQEAAEVAQWLECGVAKHTLAGETESGDGHLVEVTSDTALLAVVDGLGHGPEAAVAARTAVATLAEYAREPLVALTQRCHEALRRTRGVVMSLAALNESEQAMTWLGVGDVDGVLLRPGPSVRRESLLTRGGVVGYQLPTLRAAMLPIQRGDVLILATDGIRSGYSEELNLHDTSQQIADHILAKWCRGTDDALVLVARYRGSKP
jgi:negative regulator of sigma-B (phosphoserine phosphatase)